MNEEPVKLLIESFDCEQEILQECAGEGMAPSKRYVIKGTCMQTEVVNRNRRIYPKKVVDPEVTRYIKENVERNRAVGELDHPIDGNIQGSFKNASHKFTLLEARGNDFYAEAVVLKTPMGMTARGLMDEGVVMGMSSRAVGKTRQQSDGVRVVQGNFRLFSAGDLVTDPSAPDAYMTNLMEGKEWVWQDGHLIEREAEIKQGVNKLVRNGQLTESKLVQLFENLTKLRVRREQ